MNIYFYAAIKFLFVPSEAIRASFMIQHPENYHSHKNTIEFDALKLGQSWADVVRMTRRQEVRKYFKKTTSG